MAEYTREQLVDAAYRAYDAGDITTANEAAAIVTRMDGQAAQDVEMAELEKAAELERRGKSGFFENVGGGFGAGFVGTLESAATGAATLLDEQEELATRKVIQDLADSATPEFGDQDSIIYNLSSGLGSVAGFALPAIAASALAPAGLATSAVGLGIGSLMGVGTQAGEASERARASGVSEDVRNASIRTASPIGLIEALPFTRAFKAFKINPVNDLIEKFGVKEVTNLKTLIASASFTGGAEAAQEVAQTFVQNAVESGYNPDRLLKDDVAGAAGYGFGTGAIVQAITEAFTPRKGAGGASFRERNEDNLPVPPDDGTVPPDDGTVPPDETPPPLTSQEEVFDDDVDAPSLSQVEENDAILREVQAAQAAQEKADEEIATANVTKMYRESVIDTVMKQNRTATQEQLIAAVAVELNQNNDPNFELLPAELERIRKFISDNAPDPSGDDASEQTNPANVLNVEAEAATEAEPVQPDLFDTPAAPVVEPAAPAAVEPDAPIDFDVSKPEDASETFNEADNQIVTITDPASGGSIQMRVRPDNKPASVLSLSVPEESRGKGIGEKLQRKVLEMYPNMEGQVSNKAAATTAYRIGRRPYGEPDATLEDVYAKIDSATSVNLLSDLAQPSPTETTPPTVAPVAVAPVVEPAVAPAQGTETYAVVTSDKENIAPFTVVTTETDLEEIQLKGKATKLKPFRVFSPNSAKSNQRLGDFDTLDEANTFASNQTQKGSLGENMPLVVKKAVVVDKAVRDLREAQTPVQAENELNKIKAFVAENPQPEGAGVEVEEDIEAIYNSDGSVSVGDITITEVSGDDSISTWNVSSPRAKEADIEGIEDEQSAITEAQNIIFARGEGDATILPDNGGVEPSVSDSGIAEEASPPTNESNKTEPSPVGGGEVATNRATISKAPESDSLDINVAPEAVADDEVGASGTTEAKKEKRKARKQKQNAKKKDYKRIEEARKEFNPDSLFDDDVQYTTLEPNDYGTDEDLETVANIILNNGNKLTRPTNEWDESRFPTINNGEAAQFYFGRNKGARIVDTILELAHEVSYQQPRLKEGPDREGLSEAEIKYFESSSAGNAGKAIKWVQKNLSAEINEFLTRELKKPAIAYEKFIKDGAYSNQIDLKTLDSKAKQEAQQKADDKAISALVNNVDMQLKAGGTLSAEKIAEYEASPQAAETRAAAIAAEEANKKPKKTKIIASSADSSVGLNTVIENEATNISAQEELNADYTDAVSEIPTNAELESGEILSGEGIREAVSESAEGSVEIDQQARDAENRFIDYVVMLGDDLEIASSAISSLDMPVHPAVRKALEKGDLKTAYEIIAATSQNPLIRRFALAISKNIGNTTVEIVESLENTDSSGNFSPKNNKITLRASAANSTQVIIHEGIHAVISETLNNKSHQLTKQLNTIFEQSRDKLSSYYGSQNLDEFISEAIGNPAFQRRLVAIFADKSAKESSWDKFVTAISNFLKRMVRKPPSINTYEDFNNVIEKMLSPAPDSRSGEDLNIITQNNKEEQVLAQIGRNVFAGSSEEKSKSVARKIFDAIYSKQFLHEDLPTFVKSNFGGFLSSHMTAEVSEIAKVPSAMELHNLFNEQEGSYGIKQEFLRAIIEPIAAWSGKSANKTKIFNWLVHDSTRNQVDPSMPEFIETNGIKERYYKDEKYLIWKDYQDAWDALGPEGQKHYVTLRKTYRKIYDEMLENIYFKIDNLIEDKAVRKSLKADVFKKMFDNGVIEPFFPLTRSGKYWIEYNTIGGKSGIQSEYVVRAFKTKEDRDNFIRVLESNPEVIDVPTISTFRSEQLKKPTGDKVPPTSFVANLLKSLDKNLSNIEGVDNAAKEAISQDITKLFLDTLPEASFMKSLQKRKSGKSGLAELYGSTEDGIAGFNESAIEAFNERAYSLQRQSVSIKYSEMLRKQLDVVVGEIDEARRKGTLTDENALILKTEWEKRVKFAIEQPNTPMNKLAQGLNRFAFFGTIGFNASSALVNTTQIPLVVLPYMAGITSVVDATNFLYIANKLVLNSSNHHKIETVNGQSFDQKTYIPSVDNQYVQDADGNLTLREDLNITDEHMQLLRDVLPIVQAGKKYGLLNRTLLNDQLSVTEKGGVESAADKATRLSALFFHTTERYNRQIALIGNFLNQKSALEAKRKSGSNKEKDLTDAELIKLAVNNALSDTQLTNGGATLPTTARFAQQNIGRVAMMYKMFGIQMWYTQLKLMGQMARNSRFFEDGDAEAFRTARQQMGGMQLAGLFLSGIAGNSFYGVAAALYNMFHPDDEEDADTQVRKIFTELVYKGGVNELSKVLGGEGFDAATRIGLSNLLIAHNRYDFDPSAEKSLVKLLGGPTYGVASKMGRGFGDLYEGEYVRAFESIVPSAFGNMSKSYRYATEGPSTRRRDPIMGEVGNGLAAAQFFGFAPAEYSYNQERNQALKGIDTNISEQSTKLKKRFYLAYAYGDTGSLQEINENIIEFNRKHPFASINSQSIKDSLERHMASTIAMHNGILLSPKNRRYLNDLSREMESGKSMFD
jgi:hypothetical protein